MSFFVKATNPPKPRTDYVARLALGYAAIIVVMLLAQLFTFDDFLAFIITFDLPGGRAVASGLTAVVVVTELLALPFLLRMALSPAFRWLSIGCGWLVGGLWLFMSLWVGLRVPEATTVGFLGTLIDTTPGWWAVLLSVALIILSLWITWGMAPRRALSKSR